MSARTFDVPMLDANGKKVGMRRPIESCDGFNVTFMCDDKSRDCRCGSCWHMDRVRRMVRRWFLPLVPCTAQGSWERRPSPPEPKITAKERAARDTAEKQRATIARNRWEAKHGKAWNVPAPLPPSGGFNCPQAAHDEDATGGWGRMVRILEDNR